MSVSDVDKSQTKWMSAFNNGDLVRHATGHEKRFITGVLFDIGSEPQYRVASEIDTKWWYQSECIRVL